MCKLSTEFRPCPDSIDQCKLIQMQNVHTTFEAFLVPDMLLEILLIVEIHPSVAHDAHGGTTELSGHDRSISAHDFQQEDSEKHTYIYLFAANG